MENYGFFDAELLLDGTYDREYVAQQWADYFKLFVGNGVFASPVNQLKVLSTSGMGIKVLPGWAFLNGYWYHNDLDLDITIPPNTTAVDQTHGVFVQFNSSTRMIKVVLGENRTSVNREAPIWELKLANVTVPAGSTSISDANITDTRSVTAVCGFVTGLIDVIDTTDLFAQYQQIFENWYAQIQLEQAQKSHAFDVWMQTEEDDFDAWFDAMKGQLSTDAAGHLQAEIDALMKGGSWLHLTTIELSLYGKAVTVVVGGETYTGSFDAHGVCDIFGVREIGNATITSTDGTRTATSYIEISSYNKYTAMVAFWAATVNLSTTSSELYGNTIAVYRDGAFVGNTSFNMSGQCAYIATAPGTYRFVCTYLGEEYDASVIVTAETTYSAVINVWTATINITTSSSELYGATITIKDSDDNVVGTPSFDNTGNAVFKAHEPDTYTLSCEYSEETYFDTVEVTEETTYSASIELTPDGSTVLPTDDIQIWLACAGIMDKSYTTLDEVLADHDTLARLISDENAVDYMVRSKTFINKEFVPILSADNGKVYVNQTLRSGEEGWKVFDGNNSTFAGLSTAANDGYVGYIFDDPISISRAYVYDGNIADHTFAIEYSDDGTDWTQCSEFTSSHSIGTDQNVVDVYVNEITGAHRYWRIHRLDTSSGGARTICYELQFYPWSKGITEDETAMRYIGKRNYASDTLLDDEDWREAICESEYFEQVLNAKVPTLTADTSDVISSGDYNQYYKWKPFADPAGEWESAQASPNYGWLGYKFDNQIKVYKIFARFRGDGTSSEFKVEASNDGFVSDVNEIVPNTTVLSSVRDATVYSSLPISKYSDYRVYGRMPNNSGYAFGIYKLQFWGREDVVETDIDVYSAANDTVSITGNGLSLTCVTDATGHGTIAKSSLPAGTYTFTSSVAKDPDNLSNDYSKQIVVTSGTIEIFVMPENTLYWWGYESNDLEDMTTANGWSYSGLTLTAPTYNTQDISLSGSASTLRGIVSKTPKKAKSVSAIANCITSDGGVYGWVAAVNNKNLNSATSDDGDFTASGMQYINHTITLMDSGYVDVRAGKTRNMTVYALWYD